jgi:hypothetical protein
MNLVETIKSLKKDVLSYKVDNERLIKSKEKVIWHQHQVVADFVQNKEEGG